MLPDLDRMAVDDVAFSPEYIASEIHRQLGDIAGPIPVERIAMSLGIEDIRERPLGAIEAALVTDLERDRGAILLNSQSGRYRRRYSLAHELGHFLCGWHQQTCEKGFLCSKKDMANPRGDDVHIRQETEANQFAIELLAPERLIKRHLRQLPDLEHVLEINSALEISKTAAARRYVQLHRDPLAVIFAANGAFKYADRGDGFPFIDLSRGHLLPSLPSVGRDSNISEMVEADPLDWPGLQQTNGLCIQAIQQEDGHVIVLLHIAPSEIDAD